jgi:hypothetical protein
MPADMREAEEAGRGSTRRKEMRFMTQVHAATQPDEERMRKNNSAVAVQ